MTRKTRYRNVGAGKGIKEKLDPATLKRLYLHDRLTQTEIAQRYDCSPQFVSLLVRQYGLTRSSARREQDRS